MGHSFPAVFYLQKSLYNGIPRKLPPDRIEPLFGGVGVPDRVRWHAIPFAHGVQRRPTLQLRLKPRSSAHAAPTLLRPVADHEAPERVAWVG